MKSSAITSWAVATLVGLSGCHGSDDAARPVVLPPRRLPDVPPSPPVAETVRTDPQAKSVRLASPDGQAAIEFTDLPESLTGAPALSYRVTYGGKTVIADSELGLELRDLPPLPSGLRQTSVATDEADETYRVPAGKANPIRNRYKSATIEYAEPDLGRRRLTIEARAYDDGVAFRYVIPPQPGINGVRITRERTQFRIGEDAVTFPIVQRNHWSSYEDDYPKRPIASLKPGTLVGVPLLAEVPGAAWAAIAEAHVENYGCMLLRRSLDPPLLTTDLDFRPDQPGIAVAGPLPVRSPWRVVMLGREPGRLVESNIILNLNPPSVIADTSWIRPGKTAWNWWSGTYAEGVPFKTGMNTETIAHYIDFAADSGFPYMLIDEGWALRKEANRLESDDLLGVNPAIDMPRLLEHARKKGVRLWLWAHWIPVDRQMDAAFPLFEKWGIAGVKVDFMNRDDQWMVNWYRKVLAKAAEHHLMVSFHGAFPPDGVERTYPHLLTREAVMGTEYLKWSDRVTPEYDCTLPFTRMLAGPLDYCPGGFLNVTREQFQARDLQPMVMGTRAHQLALYVVLESYLQMVSDYPERYRGEADFTFIRQVPVTWDETRVLDGRPREFLAMARRSGAEWYVGCLTDWNARDLEIPLDFLGPGEFVAEVYADAPDADANPTHAATRRESVDRTKTLKLHLAPGGGAALRIVPAGR